MKWSHRVDRWSLLIVACGILVASIIYYQKACASTAYPMASFTMVQTQVTQASTESHSWVTATIVRHQRKDGAFKQVSTYFNADGSVRKVDSGFAEPGHGVFREDRDRGVLSLLSPASSANGEAVSERTFTDSPNYRGEVEILGYKTFILRNQHHPGAYTDLYLAPALNGLPIKTVDVRTSGTTVIEATQIIEEEPSVDVFEKDFDLPIDYSHFEWKIDELEESGHNGVAARMRSQLEDIRTQEQLR